MRYLLDFIKRTIVGGLLFLVPLAVVVIIIGKIVSAARPAATEIVDNVVGAGAVGPFALMLILCLGLIAISFAAGLLATTIIGRRAVDSLEKAVLSRVPAYTMIKSMVADAAESLANIESSSQIKAVYVKSDEGWKIGLVMDRINENMHAVFLPDAPSPTSGELMFLTADQFEESGMNTADALKCLSRLGVRSVRRPSHRLSE